jgi:hypothetical protein
MLLEGPRLEIYGEEPIDETLGAGRIHFDQPPEDLRARVDEQDLVRLVENSIERVTRRIGGPDYTPDGQILLGVLTYFYSIGVYGSDEIAGALTNNPNANSVHRLAFQNREPSVVLRRFRRENRIALESCLAEVVSAACPSLSNTDAEIETSRRVMNAIQADSCALDF